MSIFKIKRILKKARKAYREGAHEEAVLLYELIDLDYLNIIDLQQLGLSYLLLDKMYQAKNIFKDLEIQIKNLTLYNCLFVIAEWEGKLEEAEYYLQCGLELDEESASFYFLCAYFYDRQEDTQKAKSFYQKTLSLDETHYWANINLGSIYEQENENDQALIYFFKAKEIMPEGSCASYNIAVVYGKLEKFAEALKFYRDELTKKEPYIKVYNNLGLLYMNNIKDYDQAKEAFLEGIKAYPEEYDIWYNLGCLYALRKDYKNATDCFITIKHKKNDLLKYMKEDPDLDDFRTSFEYQKNFK